MKLSTKELLEKANTLLGERDDDDTLSFLEDLNDTISADKGSEDDDWKKKYDDLMKDKDELDKAWRKRYRDRFFSSDSQLDEDINPANAAQQKDKDEPDPEEVAKKIRFDDLFNEEGA